MFLYNPTAGRIPVRYFVGVAARMLRRTGWRVEARASRSADHATQLARRAAADGFHVVFAIGGDGTVRRVASGLAGTRTALGILPAGTMNVFGRELGLRYFTWYRLWALSQNVRKLAAGSVYNMDVGRCGNDHFLLWLGAGLDALTIRQLEPRPRLDKFVTIPHYVAQAVWNATQWHGQEMAFIADGQEIQGQFILAVVSNIRRYMGGLVILSREARLDDGEMDLWLFSGEDFADTARHAAALSTQRHTQSLGVRRIPFHQLQIESPSPITIQMDGDPGPSLERAEIEVLPGSLRLLVPPRSPIFASQLREAGGVPLFEGSGTVAAHIAS
jgi:YegS/Rv2252/BmrU family lipid kinase